MFSLSETTTWTAQDALERLKQSLPKGWSMKHTVQIGWHQGSILNEEGDIQWRGERADPKILFLDALGWLRLRNYEVKNPVWRPRGQETVFTRPPVKEETPDPLDLDPEEVELVYKTPK